MKPMHPVRRPREGFTLIELLVVISIIALLIAILLPSLSKAKELANRAVCSANVRSIIQSMLIYAQSNSDQFPSVDAPAASTYQNGPGTPTSGEGPSAVGVSSSLFADGYQQGSPLACMWLLVLNGQMTPKSFICPSDPLATAPSDEFDAMADYYSNFGMVGGAATASTSGQGESYSIAYPWNFVGGRSETGAWWNGNAATSDLPLVSDMAPAQDPTAAGPEQRDLTQPAANTYGPYIYNSGNHGGDGQNVGFGDGHVAWETNPYCGQAQDNIFTFAPSGAALAGGGNTLSGTGSGGTGPRNLPMVAPFDIVMAPDRNVATGAW